MIATGESPDPPEVPALPDPAAGEPPALGAADWTSTFALGGSVGGELDAGVAAVGAVGVAVGVGSEVAFGAAVV